MKYEINKAKSGINIDPKNKGKFTATKKKTGKTTEELTHSKNPITKKRAVFAENASHWKHQQGGNIDFLKPLIDNFKKGNQIPTTKNDATYVAPLQNPSSVIQKPGMDPYTQTGNVLKALPALAWEKLDTDMPFRVFNGLARLGEKVGLTPNKELWPTVAGSKLSPAQYQGQRMDEDQEKRWKAVKEGRYLGHSWGEYKNGGVISNILAQWKK